MAIRKFTVSRDDSIYEAWPDVTLTSSGKLICVFTECERHGNRDLSRLTLTESTDRGRTWSAKHYLTDRGTKNEYFNCARISTLPDGRLAILCDKSYGSEAPGNRTEVYAWFSADEGETWSAPILVPGHGYVPDKYRVLSTGRHLISIHDFGASGKREQYLWYSDDGGKTWSEQITAAADERYDLCEGCILETKDGALVCFLRENSGRGIDCLKTISRDGGETWSAVYPVPIPACHRPVAGYLRDGSVLLTHRFLQGGKGWLGSWTQNVFAAILHGDQLLETERRAQSARILPLDFDRSPVSDLGYTGWVQFPDGEIYVVNYIVDDAPKAQIRGYSLSAEDFLLPQPETKN